MISKLTGTVFLLAAAIFSIVRDEITIAALIVTGFAVLNFDLLGSKKGDEE